MEEVVGSNPTRSTKTFQNIDLRKCLRASTSRKRSRGVYLESKFGKIWTPANGFGCRGSKDGATCAHLYLIFRDVREPLSSRPPPSKSIARVAEECSWVNATSSRRAGVSPVPSRRHSSVPCAGFLPPNAAARERASNPQAGFEMGYTEGQRKIVAAPTIAVAALILAGAASASAQN